MTADLTHAQLLVIAGICAVPAAMQALTRGFIHGLWVALVVVVAVALVVLW